MKRNSVLITAITLLITGLFFACDENKDGYPYCVECPNTVPGDSIQCFSSKAYAEQFIETRSYLPDSNACVLISE